MNILYINHYAGSIKMGMEFRPYYFAREWKKMGHNVRIIAATYSHLRKENPIVRKDFEIQQIEGVEFQWIKTGTYEGNGVNRALTMVEFVGKLYVNAYKLVKQFKPDVVITSSTYPLDAFAGKHISNIAKCKYVHEGHDLWPLTLTEIGGMSKTNPFVLLMAIGEEYAYRTADHVVSVLPYSYNHMLKHGLKNKDKFTYIPNGIVLDDWQNKKEIPKEHKDLFDKLRSENKFIVCYLGGHALSNALDKLIDTAIGLEQNDGIAFVLVGKGVEKERLINKARNSKNIHFLPPVSKDEVPSVLLNADALYVGGEASPLYEFGVSLNKVYDYMMAGKPILFDFASSANNEVEEAKAGITITDLKVDILNLLSLTEDERTEMGENGKKWVLKNCEYSELANNFVGILK